MHEKNIVIVIEVINIWPGKNSERGQVIQVNIWEEWWTRKSDPSEHMGRMVNEEKWSSKYIDKNGEWGQKIQVNMSYK